MSGPSDRDSDDPKGKRYSLDSSSMQPDSRCDYIAPEMNTQKFRTLFAPFEFGSWREGDS
jgi:hypothetical protein